MRLGKLVGFFRLKGGDQSFGVYDLPFFRFAALRFLAATPAMLAFLARTVRSSAVIVSRLRLPPLRPIAAAASERGFLLDINYLFA